MTLFDERERAFENLFAHEEELRFRTLARRNQLFARWAAEHMGLRGSQFHAYIRSFVNSVVRQQADQALVQEVRSDLFAAGVEASEEQVRAAFTRAAGDASRQVRTEAQEAASA